MKKDHYLGNLEHVSDIMKETIKKMGFENKLKEREFLNKCVEFIPEKYRNGVKSGILRKNVDKNHIIVFIVKSSALVQELQFKKEEILIKIQEESKKEGFFIKDIVFTIKNGLSF